MGKKFYSSARPQYLWLKKKSNGQKNVLQLTRAERNIYGAAASIEMKKYICLE